MFYPLRHKSVTTTVTSLFPVTMFIRYTVFGSVSAFSSVTTKSGTNFIPQNCTCAGYCRRLKYFILLRRSSSIRRKFMLQKIRVKITPTARTEAWPFFTFENSATLRYVSSVIRHAVFCFVTHKTPHYSAKKNCHSEISVAADRFVLSIKSFVVLPNKRPMNLLSPSFSVYRRVRNQKFVEFHHNSGTLTLRYNNFLATYAVPTLQTVALRYGSRPVHRATLK